MENPIFVISDDHSYLGVYRTPEDAQSYLATRVAEDPALQERELHFYDGLGHRIDADRSDDFAFALREAVPPAEPEDLRPRISEGLSKIRTWLESQQPVVRNRQGTEFPTDQVLGRVNALQDKVDSGAPLPELIPAILSEFAPDEPDEPDDARQEGLLQHPGLRPKSGAICKATCSCPKP
jgi:hypothetical protein